MHWTTATCDYSVLFSTAYVMCFFFCSVLIVVDVSLFNDKFIVHIQNTLRHVLQEQMCNKRYLNIIGSALSLRQKRQTDKLPETRPFVCLFFCLFIGCVCQGRPSFGWTKRDAS